jgi:hypothetical protein
MAIAINPAYPTPDRSKQVVQRSKDEDGVLDIRWCDGVMSDGRAFRAELWAQDGVSMLTFFFSSVGLADLDQDRIKALLVSEGLVTFKADAREFCAARLTTDDGGSEMWSVNVVVGDEDNSYLADSAPLWGYSKAGPADTLFDATMGAQPISAIALDLLRKVHRARAAGETGRNARCGLASGKIYVQALAHHEHQRLWLEAVSPKFAPEAWKKLEGKAALLGKLGFTPPGPDSPNFWQVVDITGEHDLRRAARIFEAVMGDVFDVTDVALIEPWITLPERTPDDS